MLTFLTIIEKLMEDEGIGPDAGLDDARMMDEELVYIVHFCRENGIRLERETVRGILIGLWSKIGENDFTSPSVEHLLNERVDVMIPKITALEVGEEQAVIQESLQTLLSNDVAIYLQKMMEGLRSGNRASIESALTWRDKAFSSFEALRGDMANFARRVKMDYQSIENWSLNGAVLEKDGTAQLKQEN